MPLVTSQCCFQKLNQQMSQIVGALCAGERPVLANVGLAARGPRPLRRQAAYCPGLGGDGRAGAPRASLRCGRGGQWTKDSLSKTELDRPDRLLRKLSELTKRLRSPGCLTDRTAVQSQATPTSSLTTSFPFLSSPRPLQSCIPVCGEERKLLLIPYVDRPGETHLNF